MTIGFWDYITFATLAIVGAGGLIFVIWMMGLPGRIAIARKHPDAEAVKIMGYAGFFVMVPWIQAFIWAFKPTDIVDVRRFPKEEARAIDEEIERLSGKPAPKSASSVDASADSAGPSAGPSSNDSRHD
ncbi:superinfection immunity protein [Dokdonella sp.]|uniref:superinfection immunity protein n=1 Tax=Dokdonella sp. TaxID=2291710 RepID=UPI003C58C2A1